MALNIKNLEVERLAKEVARLANETKTEAIRRALAERKARLVLWRAEEPRGKRLERFLRSRVWPTIPRAKLGRRLTKEEEERILGFGPDGV